MQVKPSDLYFAEVNAQELKRDVTQVRALEVLDSLSLALAKSSFVQALFCKNTTQKGVYLYGTVGRGKTYLMDLFFATVTCRKKRQHFYEFMNEVHAELKLCQGQSDPLRKVASCIAKQAKVVCLDEFFVEDIADAMILSALLDYLFKEGLVLVTTSNLHPDQLYSEGLQKDRFLPAIALIKKNMHILELGGHEDYRLEKLWCEERYHPQLADQEVYLQFHFKQFNRERTQYPVAFELNDRKITAVIRGNSVIWFDFAELCIKPRVSTDYLALSKIYSVILLGNVPILTADDDSAVRRFIALVDTLYDQKVLLIIAAAAPLQSLYRGERLSFEFERTKSRIFEMSSWEK